MTPKTNRASHWTRFKRWLRKTDPEGLTNLDGLVALCFITTSFLAVVTLCLKLATLERPQHSQLYGSSAPKIVYADTLIVAPVNRIQDQIEQMEYQIEAPEAASIETGRANRGGEK